MKVFVFTLTVVLFFAGILVSIALHEVGHMVPAKKFGMLVTQYFVGFGKTLWKVKRGDTEYGIKAVPAGGFVRIVGMMPPPQGADPTTVRRANTGPLQTLVENAKQAEYEHVDPSQTDRLFYRHPWWQKLIVMVSGPLVNIVIAFVLFAGVFMLYGIPVSTTTVGQVSPCVQDTCPAGAPESPAQAMGLRTGDRIVAFNGTRVTGWEQLSGLIRANLDKQATVVVERGKPATTVTLHGSTQSAARAVSDADSTQVRVGVLGFIPQTGHVRQGPGYAVGQMVTLTGATVKALGSLPVKLVGVAKAIVGGERDPAGPISVVGASRMAGDVATSKQFDPAEKLATLVLLLASINLFVGLFNFVPLLPLDGGHIVGALWEGLRRGFARLRGKRFTGFVDVSKLLPVAYVVAGLLVVMGALLVVADIVNPVKLFG